MEGGEGGEKERDCGKKRTKKKGGRIECGEEQDVMHLYTATENRGREGERYRNRQGERGGCTVSQTERNNERK